MQVKELKNEGLTRELEVTVDAKDIDKQVDARLAEYGKTMKLPGFRPGKVPLNILKQRYGRAVMGEVLEKAVNDTTSKVLADKGLRPALQPKIEVTEFDEGKDLKYKMEVELIPEFEIIDLKKIKLEKPVAKPEKKNVEEALERISKQRQKTKPVEGDRASKKGDILVIDFHGRTEDGTEHPGMHSHGHRLELGSNQFIAGFEDQLVGKKKGDKVEVKVTFPEEYHMEALAGENAIFDVDINDIHEAEAVELNDELAGNFGFDTIDAMRNAIEEQLQSEYDQLGRLKLKRALLDHLDDKHDFAVPSGMQDMEFSSIKQQIAMERPDQVKDGELQLSKDEEEELTAIAERRVRLGLILSEIGMSNKIQITDQEIQRAVIEEAQKYPGQEAQVFEYYKNNRQAIEALRAPVFEDKVVDFIIEMADISEKKVSLEELTAEDDEDYGAKKKKSSSKSSGGSSEKKEASKKTASKKTAAKKTSSKKKAS